MATVERAAAPAVPTEVQEVVEWSLANWNGEQMPLDYSWADDDVEELHGTNRAIAKLAIVLAKAPYRVTEELATEVLGDSQDEEHFVRILAWASLTASRRLASAIAGKIALSDQPKLRSIAA